MTTPTVNRKVIAKPMPITTSRQPLRLPELDGNRSPRVAGIGRRTVLLSHETHGPGGICDGNRMARYQAFQWVIFDTGGRLAGLKSVPLV